MHTEDWHLYWKKLVGPLLEKCGRLSHFLFLLREKSILFLCWRNALSTTVPPNITRKEVYPCTTPYLNNFPYSYSVVEGPGSTKRRQFWEHGLCCYISTYDLEGIIPLSGVLVSFYSRSTLQFPVLWQKKCLIGLCSEPFSLSCKEQNTITQKQHTACQGPWHLCLSTTISGICLEPSQGFQLRSCCLYWFFLTLQLLSIPHQWSPNMLLQPLAYTVLWFVNTEFLT